MGSRGFVHSLCLFGWQLLCLVMMLEKVLQTTNCLIKLTLGINKIHPSYINSTLFRNLIDYFKYFTSGWTAVRSYSFTFQKQLCIPNRIPRLYTQNILQLELGTGGNNHTLLFHWSFLEKTFQYITVRKGLEITKERLSRQQAVIRLTCHISWNMSDGNGMCRPFYVALTAFSFFCSSVFVWWARPFISLILKTQSDILGKRFVCCKTHGYKKMLFSSSSTWSRMFLAYLSTKLGNG